MLIAGAGGFARQLLEVFAQLQQLEGLCFFDDTTTQQGRTVYGRFPVLSSADEVRRLFATDNRFCLGTGGPALRALLDAKLTDLGGELQTVVSPTALVSAFDCQIGQGATILSQAVVEGGTSLGRGCLVNLGAFVTHDCKLGDYVELSPGVRLSGGCNIGDRTVLGTGAVVIPRIAIGKDVVVAAGAVVTRSVPDHVMVAGVPASLKKTRGQ